ncbi:MAG: glycosyltransferase family 39 protein, partial [Thermodesulfobacteriota bacterium]|nr:glycosyltransferase family 39 protein [Thermodesulfobacteriota bacterium]
LDHPPLIAWLIRGSTELFGNTEAAVRLVPFLCWFVTAFFCFKTAKSLFDRSTAFRTLALLAVLPLFFCTGFLSTPDAPLMACWSMVFYFMHRALLHGDKTAWCWICIGIGLGLGMLAKYTMVLLAPGIFTFILMERSQRKWFTRPQPYFAIGIALLVFLPVIIWNANHDWASFLFQGPRRFAGSFEFSPEKLVGSAVLMITPAGFLALAAFAGCKFKLPAQNPQLRTTIKFVLSFTMIPLAMFFFFSLFRQVKLNWTGPIWLCFLPLMAWSMVPASLYENICRQNRTCMLYYKRAGLQSGMPVAVPGKLLAFVQKLWPGTMLCSSLVLGAVLYYSTLGLPGLAYFTDKPFLLGWKAMAREIEAMPAYRANRNKGPLVVGLDKYKIASGLAFYRGRAAENQNSPAMQLSKQTAGRSLFGEESLMYGLWYPSQKYIGRDMVLVSHDPGRLKKKNIQDHFESMDDTREIKVVKNKKSVATYYCCMGYGYQLKKSAQTPVPQLAKKEGQALPNKVF